jgi:hypothetical protein
MIKVENIEVWGFEHAIRGMRDPLNSWAKSDSHTVVYDVDVLGESFPLYTEVGSNDLALMRKLYKAGTEHRKFLRQIFVSMDITAPLYWWKEADQYRIGVTTNSCSTMHKIAAKEFELDDFSHEHLDSAGLSTLNTIIERLNISRKYYHGKYDAVIGDEDKRNKKDYWWQMIQLLPSSYNQRRTITMNYENVVAMIKQRTGHKLDEWNEFVRILKDLPYIKEITSDESDQV